MNNKHMLYIAPVVDFGNADMVGIRKKVFGQCSAFARLGYTPTLVIYENDKLTFRSLDGKSTDYKLSKILWVAGYYRHILKKYLLQSGITYDLVYIRKAFCETPFTLSATKLLRKYSKRIICEIPTYPYDEENKGYFKRHSFAKKLKVFPFYFFGMFFSDKLCRSRLKKYIDCFAVITEESECESAFGAPAVKITNGIDVESTPMRDKVPNDTLSIMAVASISYWHGYDRIILAMHEYYKNGGEKDIIFHVVGDGASKKELQQQAIELNLEKRVIFHGIRKGKELDELFNNADVGAGTFGGYRLGRDIDSDLKICEYCARALPYVTSMRDLDIPDSFSWKLLVANDDSLIDIEKIIAFNEKCNENRDRLIEMREFAQENLSWDVHLKKALDFAERL